MDRQSLTGGHPEADRVKFLESAEWQTLRVKLAGALQAMQPGTLMGDYMQVWPHRARMETQEARTAAVRRLASKHFSRNRLFHPSRWPSGGQLDAAFRAYRGNRSYRKAWEDLLAPHILEEGNSDEILDCSGPIEIYEALRRRLRRAVECELLGHSLDAGGLVPFGLELGRPRDLMALADIHLDLVYALYETPPEDRELLAAYYLIDRGSRSKLAHDLGMKPAAMRKRVERIKAKIRK